MAIITTPGDLNANSYVSILEASKYFENRPYAEAWDSISNQEAFLITATNQIDWFISFKGFKTIEAQSLSWPRDGVYDEENGVVLPSHIIPTIVKQATFELILSSLEDDRMFNEDLAGLEKIKVGPIELVTNKSGSWQPTKDVIPNVVHAILSSVKASGNTSTMVYPVARF